MKKLLGKKEEQAYNKYLQAKLPDEIQFNLANLHLDVGNLEDIIVEKLKPQEKIDLSLEIKKHIFKLETLLIKLVK